MSLADIATLGSLASSFAVLVSLVYLGIQVHQSSKHTAAQVSQERVKFGLDQQSQFIADSSVMQLMLRGGIGDPDMDRADVMRFRFLTTNMFLMIEDEFRQYRAGLIPEVRHRGFVRRMSMSFQLPGYRAMWLTQRDGFEPDFRAFMDPLAKEGAQKGLPPDPVENWRWALSRDVQADS